MPDRDAHVLDFTARHAARPAGPRPNRPTAEPPRIGVVPDLHRAESPQAPRAVASVDPLAREPRRKRSPRIGGPDDRDALAAAELRAAAPSRSRVTPLRPAPITTLSPRPTAKPTPPAA